MWSVYGLLMTGTLRWSLELLHVIHMCTVVKLILLQRKECQGPILPSTVLAFESLPFDPVECRHYLQIRASNRSEDQINRPFRRYISVGRYSLQLPNTLHYGIPTWTERLRWPPLLGNALHTNTPGADNHGWMIYDYNSCEPLVYPSNRLEQITERRQVPSSDSS